MKFFEWLNLQLFAGEGGDGASSAGAQGAAESGENAVTPEQQRLLELGVPADKLRRRAQRSAPKFPEGSVTPKAPGKDVKVEGQAAAAENTPTEEKNESPAKIGWDDFMKDPENNKRMQSIVQNRLRTAKDAEQNLSDLAPAIELLARKYGLDPEKTDYKALAKAIGDDNDYYEQRAIELGVPVETARKIDDQERAAAREARTLQQKKIEDHFAGLEAQGAELKKIYPSFDLRTELKNPVFARMTHPNVGISVADAYFAVHRNEIQTAAMQVTAQKTAEKISASIRAGARRPDESGASIQAPSVPTFNYRNASPEQREAFKNSLRDAWARGEKVYPGQR